MIKVEKLVQIKSNIYEIYFDNQERIKVYDEVILKFNLVKDQCIQENFVDEIKKYNELMIIFFKCRNSLIKKMSSKKSILSKLKTENVDDEDIEEIVNKLELLNLINDDNYLQAYVNSELNLTLNGPGKIKKHLLNEDIDEDKINNELSKYDEDFWNERVTKIIEKRKKANHKDSLKVFKIKTKEYVYNLGYDVTLDISFDEDKEISNLNKEYEKLLRKYIRKNMDQSKIKYDLLKKGYKMDDIINVIGDL